MLAIVAAVLFGIALIMDLAHVGLGSVITPTTLLEAGLLCVALHLAGNSSLKGKRMVVKSVAQRVRNRFNVAVAEIDTQDAWQVATLGIVCISDDPRHANEMLSKVIDFIEAERLDAEVGAVDMELIAV